MGQPARTQPAVLLLGPQAEELAPRLAASGYRPLRGEPEARGQAGAAPEAVILSPGWEDRIPLLRRRHGSLPLLLGVSEDSVAGRRHCLASGADDFWLPSQGPSQLLTRLRLQRQLRRGAPAAAPAVPVLQVADLRVVPEQRQVRRGSRSVELTGREYDLLLLLLRHSGRVVSRERILAAIWAESPGGASNVIEVYVRYLRRKLEAGGERRLLHTVRGEGYCLAERPPRRGDPPAPA